MSLRISTDLLRFVQIRTNPKQQQVITVNNVSARSQRIRISRPKSQLFSVDFENLASVSPGMSQSFTVSCTMGPSFSDDVIDELVIMTEAEKYPVKLYILDKYVALEQEETSLQIGVFPVSTVQVIKYRVYNRGTDPADIVTDYQQLAGSETKLDIEPRDAKVLPNSSIEFTATLTTQEAAQIHYQIRVTDRKQNQLLYQLTGVSVQPTLIITNNDKQQVEELVFKSLYFNRAEQRVTITNPMPFETRVDLTVVQKDKFDSFSIEPRYVVLAPSNTQQVKIVFAPKMELAAVDASNSYYEKNELESNANSKYSDPEVDNETLQSAMLAKFTTLNVTKESEVKLVGFAKKPAVQFSKTSFEFDRDLEDQDFSVKNLSTIDVVIGFKMPCGVHLDSKLGPVEGQFKLQAKEQKIVQIWYNNKQKMRQDDFAHFFFGNEYFNVNFRVITTLTKLKPNLNATSKYVTQIINSGDNVSGVMTQSQIAKKMLNATKPIYEQAKLELMQTKHDYTRHLEQSDSEHESERDSKDSPRQVVKTVHDKISAYNDGLDLGLQDTQYDVNKYDYRENPKIKNKTIDVIQQAENIISQQNQPKERPALKNDTQPTIKQYGKNQFEGTSFNKIEVEVKTKILQRQMNNISIGNNSYDFGELSVLTENTKYFKVANDLQQYIKVDIIVVPQDQQLVQFTIQETQYLPPGCYSSFEIQCKFTQIGKVDTKLEILVNEQHFSNITIKANVVRPKLFTNFKTYNQQEASNILSKHLKCLQQGKQDIDYISQLNQEILFMELNSANAFQLFVERELTIQNTGTTQCDAFFDVQNPCQDIILSKKNAQIEVFAIEKIKVQWKPMAEEFISNVIVLSFAQGYSPYYIPIICKLLPGKGQLAEKQLDVGIINVSKQLTSSITIQNKSNAKPVYYELLVDELAAQTNIISVTSEMIKGEIQAGEQAIVPIQIEAKLIGIFNVKLQIRIIGGDILHIPIRGQVEQPHVYVYPLKSNRDLTTSQLEIQQKQTISFESSVHQIVQPLTAHAPSIQRFVINNIGKVQADLFVDVRQSPSVDIMESDLQPGVSMKAMSRQDMEERITKYSLSQSMQPTESRQSQKGMQRNRSDSDEDQTRGLAQRYSVPLLKSDDSSTYEELLNALMSNQPIQEKYGPLMLKSTEAASLLPKSEQNKICFIQLPPGKQYQLNIAITENKGVESKDAVISFFSLGSVKPSDIDAAIESQELLQNQLKLRYKAVNSVIQTSTSKLYFGIKVADAHYKQNILQLPIQHKDVFNELIKKEDKLPFMKYAANTGLYYQDFTLQNQQNQQLKYVIEMTDLNDMPSEQQLFMTSHPFGILNQYDSVQIRIYYSPCSVGVHHQMIKIYYSDELIDNTFFLQQNYKKYYSLQVHCQATAIHRSLCFSISQISLPNTHIGTPSRAQFWIYNIGYKNTTKLQVFFPPELSKVILSLKFPWGNQINHMVKALPVVLTFYAEQPVSFLTQLTFLDEAGVPYPIMVGGNAFASSYNLQEYVKVNQKYLTGLDLKSDKPTSFFPTISKLQQIMDNQQELQQYQSLGFTKANIQALISLNAEPVMELSDYAKLIKLDSGYQSLKQQYVSETEYQYMIQVQPTPVSPAQGRNKTQVIQTVTISDAAIKKIQQGPFVDVRDFNLLKLKYMWQYQFKQVPNSEAPLSPFLVSLQDVVAFDDFDKRRFELMIALVNQLLGLRVTTQTFFNYVTQVQTRSVPFFQWATQMFRQNFCFQGKDLTAVPTAEDLKVAYVYQGMESILNCLKLKGAMVNNISAVLLLGRKEYAGHCKKVIAKQSQICFTTSDSEPTDQQLLNQQSQALLSDIVLAVHDRFHRSAWFHILSEISRLYIINFASNHDYLLKIIDNHKQFATTDGVEFVLDRGVGGKFTSEDFALFTKHYENVPKSDVDPDSILLYTFNYFLNFQLIKNVAKLGPVVIDQFEQLWSGLHIACFIVSFVQNSALVQAIEDTTKTVQSIMDQKAQRNRPCSFIDALCLSQKDIDVSDKLVTQIENCRQNLWKEITTFVKNMFQLPVYEQMFYCTQKENIYQTTFTVKLLAAYIYQLLPSYIPQKTLRIDTSLSEPINQQLDILGHAKCSMRYFGTIVFPHDAPSCELTLDQNQLIIEPKTSYALQLHIKANYIKQCFAIIQLKPIYEALQAGFIPQASYIGVCVNVIDKSVKQELKTDAECGAQSRLTIKVENTTPIDARYKVQIEEQFFPVDPQKITKIPKPGKSPLAYKSEKLIIVPNKQTKELYVYFNPTHPGLYTATVTIIDDKIGSRTFDLKGFALLPSPTKTLKFVCQSTEAATFSFTNVDIDCADKSLDHIRYALMPIGHTNQLAITVKEQKFNIQYIPKAKMPADTYTYRLITLFDSFTKVSEIQVLVVKRCELVQMVFEAKAREIHEQEIIIINPESFETECTATLQCATQNLFFLNNSCVFEHKIKLIAGRNRFLVKFQPTWLCDEQARLTIKQNTTNIIFGDYQLIGKGLEPACSGKLAFEVPIMELQQRSVSLRMIEPITNCVVRFDDDVVFKPVAKMIDLSANENLVKFTAQSFSSGKFESRLYVDLPSGAYYWFEVNVAVPARASSGVLEATCAASQSIELQAALTNPVKQYATFAVSVEELPAHFMEFNKQFTLGPGETAKFPLTFRPFAAGKWAGKLKFFSTALGEFWYQIKVACDEIRTEQIQLEAAIGTEAEHKVLVENSANECAISYTVEMTNTDAYQCARKQFLNKPGESNEVIILYRPTRVNESEINIVTITGRDVQGTIRYQKRQKMVAQGTLQKETPVIKIFAQLNQGTAGSIQFKNPFLQKTAVRFDHSQTAEFTFQYKDSVLEPQQQINVKYFFVPKKLSVVQSTLRIVARPNPDDPTSQQFPFEYVFEGVGEYTHKQSLAYLECQSRQKIQRVIELPQEIQIEDPASISFEIECNIKATNPFEDTALTVKRSLKVGWQGCNDKVAASLFGGSLRMSNGGSGPPQILGQIQQNNQRAVEITFAPLKPFACDVMLMMNQKEGGRYKVPISLFAAVPAAEGLITVELPNGSTAGEHQFGFCNVLATYSEYRAYFTPSSSDRFTVSPNSGILEPSQQTGISTVQKQTHFKLGCQAGPGTARGQLVVETKDIVFLWDVISGYKKYIPPVGKK